MKATLTFDLTDRDESIEHLRCIKALDLTLAIHDILQIKSTIQEKLERQTNSGKVYSTTESVLEEIFSSINDIMINRNICIDEILI